MARYCKPKYINEDELPDYQVFMLRREADPPEKYLSVYSVECFKKDNVDDALKEICRVMKMKTNPCSYQVKPSGRFVVLNVSCIINTVYEYTQYMMEVKRDDDDHECPESHLGIFVPEDMEENKLIALCLEDKIRDMEQAHNKCVYKVVC